MKESSGCFEVEIFPAEVDSPDHPYAAQFREMLENVAEEYQSALLSFEVHEGIVTFSFDSDELNAEIIEILKESA
jgi:outer membrane protein OmpA-like peptidoglycan-associated protein